MRIVFKVWLDQDGKAFGDGPYELLKRVQQTDSLHQAADQMGMAYSKAWGLIQALETRLGYPLLERQVGGRSGGGSRITPQAIRLMNRYELFRKDIQRSLQRIYQKHFGERLSVLGVKKSRSRPNTSGRRTDPWPK